MSEASSGEELWRCVNPNCPPHPYPVPLLLGCSFTICPFCHTPQPQTTAGTDGSSAGDPVPKQPHATDELVTTSDPVVAQAQAATSEPGEGPAGSITETSNISGGAGNGNNGSESGQHQVEGNILNNQSSLANTNEKAHSGSGKQEKVEIQSLPQPGQPASTASRSPSNTADTTRKPPATPEQTSTTTGHSPTTTEQLPTTTGQPPATSGQLPTLSPTTAGQPPTTTTNDQSDSSCEFYGKRLLNPSQKHCINCKDMQQSNKGHMVPSEKLHTGYQPSESPQEMEEGEKKGPSCQNCGELLLSSTAHVCGKCSHPHREKTVEKLLEKKKKDDQSSKTTSQQYQPVFGQSTTDGLACATNQKNNGSTGSSRKRHSNLNSNNKLNTDSGSDSELFVDAPSEFVAGSSPQEPPSKFQEYRKKDKPDVLFPGKPRKATTNPDSQGSSVDYEEKADVIESSVDIYPSSSLPGLSNCTGKMVVIFFHVLIPKPFWEWDSESKVFLRFGCSELGKWNRDIGDFTRRDVDKSICEMTCRLSMDSNIPKNCVPYKYVVFTSKSKRKRDTWYEFLHFSGLPGISNRALILSNEQLQVAFTKGEYHWYDHLIFPKDLKVSRVWTEATKFFSNVGKLFHLKKEVKEVKDLTLPTDTEMRQTCLEVYFDKYSKIIRNGNFSCSVPIPSVVEDMENIFNSLTVSYITYFLDIKGEVKYEERKIQTVYPLKMAFLKWLTPIVKSFTTEACITTEKRLASATCVTWCISKLSVSPNSNEVRQISDQLLRSLCARKRGDLGDNDNQWLEYNNLCQLLPSARKEVAEAVKTLISEGTESQRGCQHFHRLFGIPLFNFLTAASTPFDDIYSKDSKTLLNSWDTLIHTFKLQALQRAVSKVELHLFQEHFEKLQDLFELDPSVLQAFLFICPIVSLESLFTQTPPHVCISWLSYLYGKVHFKDITPRQYIELISAIQKNISSDMFPRLRLNPKVLVNTAVCFFVACATKYDSDSDYLELFVMSISLFFTSLHYFYKVSLDENSKKKLIVQKYFDDIQETLYQWVTNNAVVGGDMFGCQVTESNWISSESLEKNKLETRIWKALLSVKIPAEKLGEDWFQLCQRILRDRISKVPDSLIVSLLKLMEDNSEEHKVLTNEVMSAAVRAAEKELSKSSADTWEKMTKEDSKLLGRVLGTLLKKKYPHLKSDSNLNMISLDILLDWVHWPNYIKIVNQGNKSPLMKDGLSPDSQILCVCAYTKFRDVCTFLQTGEISISDLHKLADNKILADQLCAAVITTGDKDLTYESVMKSLSQRLNEYKFFCSRQKAYRQICEWIPYQEKVQGLVALKKVLTCDYSSSRICDLCHVAGGTIELKCFQDARPLNAFITQFSVMMNNSSILFLHPLGEKFKSVVQVKPNFFVADIYPEVWKPIFEHCHALIKDLVDQNMTLSFVDAHLKDHSENLFNIVSNLAVGIAKCSALSCEQIAIRNAVWKIEQYWRICEYKTGARVFIQLRDVLKLTGDFNLVEKISLQLPQSMGNQTLASIDETLTDTGDFLEEIAKDQQKQKCLETYRDCQKVITWLQEFTKSVNDVQGFVTIALATAAGGEGDYASDNLSRLRTVASGFASLVYEVKESDGCMQLMERCKSLWEALKKNHNLPELLTQCNNDLGYYKSVKETQGSVETTSYGQMTNILKYGTYRVGFKRNAQTVPDLITVMLTQRRQKLFKSKYTLDELRDLESKLVLICGNKSDTRAEVDHYLNLLHSATRIAELYLDLQRAGNVTFLTATLQFRCAVYDVLRPEVEDPEFNEVFAKKRVSDLQDYTRMLDEQLMEWKKSVDTAREKYYELNYFTTLQLLELRRELGHLVQPTRRALLTPILKPSILMLLKSVSPEVSSTVVFESLQATCYEQEVTLLVMEKQEESVVDIPNSESTVGNEPMATTAPISTKPIPISPKASPSIEFPLPTFTYEELDDKQHSIYVHCVEFLGFTSSHVLRAFHECKQNPKLNLFDIEEWCENNKDQSSEQENDSFYESGEETLYETEDFDSEEIVKADDFTPQNSDNSTAQRDEFLASNYTHSIRSVMRQSRDESHPDVQELVEAGYNLQAAIDAIDKFGNVERAMDYLNEQERQQAEETSCVGEFLRSVSREDCAEDCEVDVHVITELRDSEASKNHLELDQLGQVLQVIGSKLPGAVSVPRTFDSALLKAGLPNLLVTSSENVLRSVLALYTSDIHLPLPTQEEVLLCTDKTTTEEVTLLWRRAIDDPDSKRIFCLAHAEKLSYQVCDAAVRSLDKLSQGKDGYRLVVISSMEDEDKSYIISRLHSFRRLAIPCLDETKCRDYLKVHFTMPADISLAKPTAAVVDPDNSCVRVVSSTRSGMGKSLFIKKKAQELIKLTRNQDVQVTIPIHSPVVTGDTLLGFFDHHNKRDPCTLYHLDIAPKALSEIDCLLFSLLILNGLSDSRGHVWRCQPSQLYMVEVTIPENTTSDDHHFQTLNLLSLLPTVQCVSPRVVQQSRQLNTGQLGMDEEEFRSPSIQRVYQYLRRHTARSYELDTFSYHHGCVEGSVRDFLKIVLSICGIRNPSWSEVHHFTKFLDIQLHSCESSLYCDEALVGDVISGLKSFVVKFMIRMSQDFSTPSLVLAHENQEKEGEGTRRDDQLKRYQIVKRRRWEHSFHPYLFFNEDCVSITFVGFKVTPTGDLINPEDMKVIEQGIMMPKLYKGLKQNKVNFDEDYRGWSKEQMITKIATVMGLNFVYDPDGSYVLTSDNLVKMLAIQMRFRCDIPVVIMGETGCGKTRLIRYMCDMARNGRDLKNMLMLKIHGGICDADIIKFVEDAEKAAQANKDTDTVAFFDEANTTESIGLIKEIMCDRRMNGRPVSKDLKFIAACNPYVKHSQKMVERLETAGLGFYVRETETKQKLGKIPLRQLVYRVLDLPPSMTPLVYDFGQLNTGAEYDYTKQIVKDRVKRHPTLCLESPAIIPAISRVLAASQKFMRDQKNECSFVSLRDVERAMIVFEYFYEKMEDVFTPLMDKSHMVAHDELCSVHVHCRQYSKDKDEGLQVAPFPSPPPVSPSDLTRALLLSLNVCYHARLQDREPYEEEISQTFTNPLSLPGGAEQFRDEIKWCQEGLLDQMVLGPNIAKNAALRENVFMMAICIELRIPLFLVGKPGSSKSLAKSIIQDSMHGQGSRSDVLKKFKQVHIFSYQCSQLSTPESVIEVFKVAEKFQAKQDIKQYVSVVVLDEVGLAEDSPSLPLKALHPLLEDGTEGSAKGYQHKTIEREKRVAFIGISNWALDPAKMNRGVMVTRGEPGLKELVLSAHGICSTKERDPVREQLRPFFEALSLAYLEICKQQKRQFFGLRDYYSLIKMLYCMCNESKGYGLSRCQLEHAIKRNFGGLESNDLNLLEVFMKKVGHMESTVDLPDKELHSIMNPDCTRLGLIRTSLQTKDTTWHGENRYLLFLTENYAALDILKHYLNVNSEGAEDDDLTSQPYILFGSSFPKDKEYTQVCRNINQIKICMETGRTVILLNLENLYESLYDVLNQYYMYSVGVRYVDLGLQTHRVKCRVHDNFKLILIAEKDTVYNKFPTPLINRLEKHFVLTSSVLEDWQNEVLEDFERWIQEFSGTRDNQFKEAHAFIGYQNDTPAAVIFQATNLLKRLVGRQGEKEYLRLQLAGVLDDDLSVESTQWCQTVLRLSQFLLLQTAAEDALIRLKKSSLSKKEAKVYQSLYYKHQHHHSIREFLEYECREDHEVFMQVTTHSPLMTQEELQAVANSLSMGFAHFDLHEFDSELDFSNKIGPQFVRKESQFHPFLVVVQCNSGHLNCDLIACARYRVCDEAIKAKTKNKIQGRNDITHILFVIRLPQQEVKSQFVGFQGDPWISVHIDDLRPTSEATVIPEQALTAKISELFIGELDKPENLNHPDKVHSLSRSEETMFEEPHGSSEMSVSTECSQSETDSYREEDMSKGSSSSSDEDNSFLSVDSMTVEDVQTEENGTISPLSTDDLHLQSTMIKERIPLTIPIVPLLASKESQGEVSMWEGLPSEMPVERIQGGKQFHAQHQRLLGCVQAAVSMLKYSEGNRSMLRIQKLIALLPKKMEEQLDEGSFYALLVKLIHRALKEREEVRVDERDWVLMEAMNRRKLQSGGTFRNVLARHIDEVITPYFAELIAHIDQNCNLDLLDTKNLTAPISLFWLKMFSLTGGRIDFSSLSKGKADIKTYFPCQLPFSWFVRDEVEAQRANMLGANVSLQYKLKTTLNALSQTELGEILITVPKENVMDLYHCYLYDFVRYVHQSGNKGELAKMEYKLIMDALDAMTYNPELCSGQESLSHMIVALHIVYSQCATEVVLFGQLVLHRPGILRSLSNPSHQALDLSCSTSLLTEADWGFTLHLSAVQRVLESDQEEDPTSQTLAGLNPPLHKEKQADVTQNILRWLNHVHLSQNVIDTILRSSIKNEVAVNARLTWQRVKALQIFAEKVYIPHCTVNRMHFIIRRLEIVLKRHADFLKRETLDGVKQLLNNMFSKLKVNDSGKAKLKNGSNRFFIEVVSSLCFGGMEAPEPALIKVLLDTVLHDTKTSKLSPYKEPDKTPTIRSFLLQLLLEKERDQVKEYLRDYFDRSLRVIGGQPDQGLCLLCVQCIENALRKRASSDCRSPGAAEILEESYLSLLENTNPREPQVSLQYLQSVAGIRFGLSVAAEQLKNGCADDRLLHITHDLCVDHRVNVVDPTGRVDTTGPALYMLKLLIRQFGYSCLKAVSTSHPWIIPEELRKGDEMAIDPFILYGEGYIDLRSAINASVFTKKTDELTVCLQGGCEPSFLTFALYQRVTLSRASRVPTEQIQDGALQTLKTFLQEATGLSPDMMHVSRLLLGNQQGRPLAQLTVSPDHPSLCRELSGIVIHCVGVILSRTGVDLLLPFQCMLNNPTAIENAYLPTMAEDLLHEVRKAGGRGAFYVCQNHHPYFVGDCGRPMVQRTCPECGAPIGGRHHILESSNKAARLNDTTKTGYDLGPPDRRSLNPERERDLSAPAVCVVRALMHSAFIWAACNNQEELVELSRVTKDQVRPSALPEFFWLHLEKDLTCLSRSTGRGLDECIIIVHLVLQQILGTNPPASHIVADVKHLQSKDGRRQWEQLFSSTYIDPVLTNLDTAIAKALDKFANDDQQEHDQLFYLAYEKVKVDETKLQAHLWTFRQQINLEHLQRSVQSATAKKMPVLDAFLQAEPSLRATQYLPDIVKLQRFLFDMYNKRLEKGKAETYTVKDFLREVKERFNENTKNECQVRIESLRKSWSLVCHKLKNHRLPVEEDHLLPEITHKTRLVYLIPTTMREGRCTTALVDYLVIAHNNFIEHCRSVVSKGAESAAAVWREHKVPITHLHRSHMLEYEQHLQSIILSHCHYSLTVGKGQQIEYDHEALEKHILDRFIYGKPVIQADIPNVSYRKDIYTVESFLEIRRKVKPQVPLDQAVQQDITTELKTPDKLRESLDVVDIVLGLLSSGGGNPKRPLKQFIDTRKMSRKSFSAKAKEHCTLGHIISLWETISVELARKLWERGQEPFEAIPSGYTRELSDAQRSELDECLRNFNLGFLLGVLFEFTEVHVKQITGEAQKSFELVDALDVYWGMTEQTSLTHDTLEGFPNSLTVDQAVATWKHIADYNNVKRH